MSAVTHLILETAPAVLLFAAIFLAGEHIHPLRALIKDRRTFVSFTAGMSAAYVFVHMMPELHEAREMLVEAASETIEMKYEGISIYFVALIGFICFYGLDRLRAGGAESGEEAREESSEKMHLGGMAAYVGLTSYLLVRSAGESITATVIYALAFGGHFLALEHSLREEYGEAFLRRGRWLMAVACLLGWAIGVSVGVPAFVLALLVAFISGGVIMTNTLMELSEGKDGRFGPFMAGSLIYGLMLVPLG
jgi:hypothetical protein